MNSFKNKDGIYVVRDRIDCERYSFEGSAQSIKDYIDSIVNKANEMGMVGDGYFDLSIESGYYDSSYITIQYLFERVENELERSDREAIEARVKAEAAAKRKAAAERKKLKADAEYQEFLRLKEKFGVLEK